MKKDHLSHFSVDSIKTSMSLVRAVVQRDPDAWVKLVRLYYPLVVRWAQKQGLRDDSEDVASEVMIKAVNGLKLFNKNEPDQMFRKWLRTITKNVITDHRNNKPNAFGGSESHFANLAEPIAEDETEVAEDRKTLFVRAIQLLEQKTKNKENCKIFKEVVVHGRKPTHVAEDFKISVGRVYQIKSRYLRMLKEEFAELITQ